jgi:regulator of sigma E protease
MTIVYFLFVLGVLVFVHELGHFLVARWYGVKVLTFSLGFGPKLLKYRRGDTEYCISAVPLGGYVKLAGETVDDRRTGAPDEFLSKSKWVRFQVYLAGPVMNLLLAFFLVAGILAQGADVPLYTSAAPVIGVVDDDSPAGRAGLQPGDLILRINGRDVPTWDAVNNLVLPRAGRELTLLIERQGQRQEFRVVPQALGRYEMGRLGISPKHRPQVTAVLANEPASLSGLRRGDVVLALDGRTDFTQPEIIEYIRAHANQPIVFTVERGTEHGTEQVDVKVVPKLDGEIGRIGATIRGTEVRWIDPNAIEALKLSAKQNWDTSVEILGMLKGLITRDVPVRQLMGPVSIASLSGTAGEEGWDVLFGLMATISLNLALLNLMPIPVLDGGQIMILAVEGVARRDLSIKVKERILLAGAALIIMLMVTVIYNDIARLLR